MNQSHHPHPGPVCHIPVAGALVHIQGRTPVTGSSFMALRHRPRTISDVNTPNISNADRDGTSSNSPSLNPATAPATPRTYPTETFRALNIAGMPNIRDIGGIQLNDGGVVECGKVLRSASPQFLTEQGAHQLHDYGVRTIIDLRSPAEADIEGVGHLQPLIDAGRIVRRSIPIMSDAERDIDPIGSVTGVDEAALHYVNYLRAADRFVTIVETVIDTAEAGGSSLLHCALGKDRTGVSISLILDAVGAERNHIVDDYALTAPHVTHMVNVLARSQSYRRDFTTPNWASLAPQPHGIAGMLHWLDQNYGGAAGYLSAHGLSPQRLTLLQNLLRYTPQRTN